MRHSSLCVVLGIVLMLVAGALSRPANATAVTVGTNYQEGSDRVSISPPSSAPDTCNGFTTYCYVIFNIVPAGKQLLITDVSCRIYFQQPVTNVLHSISIVTFSTTNVETDRAHNFIPMRTASSGNNNQYYTAVTVTRQLLKAGERPVIKMTSLASGYFIPNCSISGKVGNPPE